MVGILTFGMFFLRFNAISKDSMRCITDGMNLYE